MPDAAPSRASASRTSGSGSARSTCSQSIDGMTSGRPVAVTTRAPASSVITETIART